MGHGRSPAPTGAGGDAGAARRARAGPARRPDVANLDVPETVHALVAARLDNLEHDERALLQDAAVLGVSFTPAALAAVSERPEAAVRRTLDHLVSKQVLGRDDDPRLADAGQYHFLQALLRTIALGRLSRRHRKASHLAAANH